MKLKGLLVFSTLHSSLFIFTFFILHSSLFTLTSCEDYLSVQPKSQVLADEYFSDDQAYNDFLLGSYEKMCSESLYGRNLTFGLVEVLSQNYDLSTSNPYYEASQYNYTNSDTRSMIDNIWSGQYNVIANLNLLLQYIDETPANRFEGNNYYLYKGEAMGLRAFLHFDLLRLFSPAYTYDKDAVAIPYVTEYSTSVTPQKTVAQTIQLIKDDLYQAREYLRKGDKLYLASSDSAYYYRGSSLGYYGQQIFNYYAATATLARVYMWEENLDSAFVCANEITTSVDNDEYKFSWAHYSSIETNNIAERDFLYNSEHIFRLNVADFDDITSQWFTATAANNNKLLTPNDTKQDQIFEISTKALGADYRYVYNFISDGGDYKYMAKFWQSRNNISFTYVNMLPLIRMTEMYYICAEAMNNVNRQEAVRYLNTVRHNRNLGEAYDLTPDISSDALQEEVYKEYRKEYLGEGQLFYYYKRKGYDAIPGSGTAATKSVYVLPYPDNEVEFGSRQE